jgi:hypothetical protein
MSKEVSIYSDKSCDLIGKPMPSNFYKWLEECPVEFFMFDTGGTCAFGTLRDPYLDPSSLRLRTLFTHSDYVLYKFEIEDPKDDIVYDIGKPMSPEFYTWLEDCPEKFSVDQTSAAYVTYKFETEDPEIDRMEVEEIKAEKRHNEGLRWPR